MINRRSLFQLFGAAAATVVSAPLSGVGKAVPAIGAFFGPAIGGAASMNKAVPKTWLPKSILKVIGIPQWIKDQWKQDSIRASYDQEFFHPDILANKSWSASFRRLQQADYSLRQTETDFFQEEEHKLAKMAFRRLHGNVDGITGWDRSRNEDYPDPPPY